MAKYLHYVLSKIEHGLVHTLRAEDHESLQSHDFLNNLCGGSLLSCSFAGCRRRGGQCISLSCFGVIFVK